MSRLTFPQGRTGAQKSGVSESLRGVPPDLLVEGLLVEGLLVSARQPADISRSRHRDDHPLSAPTASRLEGR